MLTDHQMQELLNYAPGVPVVSVYLNTDPSEGTSDVFRLQLRNMLKQVETAEEAQVIERYVEHEHDWSGRSLVMFSCAAEGFFRAYSLAVPVRSRLRVSSRPYVKPLADLLDAYGGYGVVLVDKQGARLFFFHLGTLQEQEGISGESVRRTKRGGGSQARGRRGGIAGLTRYVEKVTERNFKESVEAAVHFFEENHVRRVLIGGTEDNVATFRNLLPKAWQSLVVGTFPMSMNASHAEVLERAIAVGAQAERQQEEKLVRQVITAAAKGRGGVIRLDDTLGAVHEGRVQILLISEGFRAPGYRCEGCEFITAQELTTCPFCQHSFERIPDAVELAVRKVMQDGGEVAVLHQVPELDKAGRIGALLRY